jgi:hypothetical protein
MGYHHNTQRDKYGIQHQSDEFQSVPVVFRHNEVSHDLDSGQSLPTDVEKSGQGLWNTPPSPIFGVLLVLSELGGKRSFYLGKNPSLKTGSITE